MTAETKAALMSRLEKIVKNPVFPTSNSDVCMATIAICMLENVVTDEENTHHPIGYQIQYGEEEVQVQTSVQQEEESLTD